jgi:hypothetical protein
VQYPSAEVAAAGRAALANSPSIRLFASDAHANLLGAVLGKSDKATASSLLVEALVTGNRVGNAGRSERTETRPCVTSSG